MITENENRLIEQFTAKDGSTVCIRPATVEDARDIVTSVESIIKEGTYLQKEQTRSVEEEQDFILEMQRKGNMYAVIELNGAARGIARVIRGELKMKQHTGLFRTWLSDVAQGKGIGSHIMDYTLKWCNIQQLHKLCLTVFSTNEVAVNLYKKAGFIIEGVQKEQAYIQGQFTDEIWMAYFFQKGDE